jgi:hypothetical protein
VRAVAVSSIVVVVAAHVAAAQSTVPLADVVTSGDRSTSGHAAAEPRERDKRSDAKWADAGVRFAEALLRSIAQYTIRRAGGVLLVVDTVGAVNEAIDETRRCVPTCDVRLVDKVVEKLAYLYVGELFDDLEVWVFDETLRAVRGDDERVVGKALWIGPRPPAKQPNLRPHRSKARAVVATPFPPDRLRVDHVPPHPIYGPLSSADSRHTHAPVDSLRADRARLPDSQGQLSAPGTAPVDPSVAYAPNTPLAVENHTPPEPPKKRKRSRRAPAPDATPIPKGKLPSGSPNFDGR